MMKKWHKTRQIMRFIWIFDHYFDTMGGSERSLAPGPYSLAQRKMAAGVDTTRHRWPKPTRDVTPHEDPTTLDEPSAIVGREPGLLPGPGMAESQPDRRQPGRMWPPAAPCLGRDPDGGMVPRA